MTRFGFNSFAIVAMMVALSHSLTHAETPPNTAQEASDAEQEQKEEDPRRSRVCAKIGDYELTVGMLEDEINRRSPFVRRRLANPDTLKKFVDNQVEAELLYRGALKAGFAEDPKVRRAVGESMAQSFLRGEFDDKMHPSDISEADVKAYFKEHPAEFSSPAMRRASHILVATKEEATSLIQELTGKGSAKFTEFARAKSLDEETKQRGGDLLFFAHDGRMPNTQDAPVDKTLVEAAFRLKKVGEVSSKPVAVGGQWSVVRLTGIRDAQERTLEQASDSIRRRLWRERRREALEGTLTKLRQELKPERYPERVEPIVLPKTPPGMTPPEGH